MNAAASSYGKIPADQPFVPVLLGGDIGIYAYAREFHQAYGVISKVVSANENWLISDSVAIDPVIVGPMVDEDVVIPQLIQLGRQLTEDNNRPLLLLSGFDHLVKMIVKHRDDLSIWYTIPYPSLDAIEKASDKVSFQQLCRELDIPHPRTLTIDLGAAASRQNPMDTRVAGISSALNRAGLGWPVIVKPADSGKWASAAFENWQKVYVINSLDEMLALFVEAQGAGYDGVLLIQEYVGGGDENMRLLSCFLDADQNVRLSAYAEVALEDHNKGTEGNSLVILSGEDATVQEHGAKILKALGWEGFAMFDLKVDPKDGQAKFFELNPRLGRNHMYITAAGENPAEWLVRHYLPQIDATPLPESVNLTGPSGYTVLPLAATYRQGSPEQQRRLKALGKALLNPYHYEAETSSKRKFTVFSRQAKWALDAFRR
ncbi:carboxylate--amine ligase [Micrococcoides hystricis]|uniref:Carbamoyl-phosphate synthase n=1 Tax=Micrococcoides hystricis TaxID=1572761 RepID=A0ABV6PBM3_9MICC